MDNLKAIMEGEYGNVAPLLGLNTDEGAANLLGTLAKLPKEQQAKALKNLFKGRGVPGGSGSRYEMEAKLDQLPEEIVKGLRNKRLQLADTRFYVVKEISAKSSIDVFQGTDPKSVGLGNIANQKLEKDNWLLVSGIIMRYATFDPAAGGKDVADYTHIPAIIRNGEFELEAGNKKLVGLMENSAFDTRNRTDIPLGYYKLESTKVIEPQVEIKMPVKFTASSAANTVLRVQFVGTSVIPF